MRVSLNLVGMLADYYPDAPDCSRGPVVLECADGTTVRALLDGAGVPDEEEYFIMLNGDRIDLAGAAQRSLSDGDVLALVAVIKGG
ncbi:MAG: MoaD/ThiS family protein [Gammaproteobacteria bacterium]